MDTSKEYGESTTKNCSTCENYKQKAEWKPIEPVCEKCGGTGEICQLCGLPQNSCSRGLVEQDWLKECALPCPACSEKKPEKEKRLMVPVRWEHNISNSRHELFFPKGAELVAFVYLHNGRWRAVINGIPLFDKSHNRVWKETEGEIKHAVEKALGLEVVTAYENPPKSQ
jgi:hypothetical protein